MKTFDTELERNTILLLMESEVVSLKSTIRKLRPEWLQSPDHQKALSYIQECVDKNTKPDYSVLSNRTGGTINRIDGQIGMVAISHDSYMTMIDELRKIYIRKLICNATQDMLRVADDNPLDALSVFKDAESRICSQAPTRIRTGQETLALAFEETTKALNGGNDEFVPYCIEFMDSNISLMRKQIHVMGAYQGKGKTALSIQAADKQAYRGHKIAYFCVESKATELAKRQVAHHARISALSLVKQAKNAEDRKRIEATYGRLLQRKNYIEFFGSDDFKRDMGSIELIARSVADRLGGLDMLYVDFLQKLYPPSHMKGDSAERRGIEYNMGRIKELCESLNCAGTILAQFNRDSNKQPRPSMNSFRGSGSIEDDAHVMSVIHETKHNRGDGYSEYEYYLVKGRLFDCDSTMLCFHGQTCTFSPFFSANSDPIANGHKFPKSDLPDMRSRKNIDGDDDDDEKQL